MGYKKLGSKLKINNKEFIEEIIKSKAQNKLTDKATDFFIKMACHAIRDTRLNYPDPRDIDDCIQMALHDMCKYWRNFDETQNSNPFAFFTSFTLNGYAKQFKEIHKHRFVRYNHVSRVVFTEGQDKTHLFVSLRELYDEFVDRYGESCVKKTQYKVKSKKKAKWMDFSFDDIDTIPVEVDGNIEWAELRIEYTDSVSFISFNQPSDNEIYSI